MNNDTGQCSFEERQVLALERIAKALESKNQPEADELASYPLARFATFDWSEIGGGLEALYRSVSQERAKAA